ncbi:MAG: hypothetical protein KTR30_08930 [Saprospiraceae bacterium]|nr:hypothetical protein [Saprospiraceae bacterium]
MLERCHFSAVIPARGWLHSLRNRAYVNTAVLLQEQATGNGKPVKVGSLGYQMVNLRPFCADAFPSVFDEQPRLQITSMTSTRYLSYASTARS